MSTPETHVIVGASLAGASAAQTLRSEGFAGRIVLLGAELHHPYERPPLSKGILQGDDLPTSAMLHDPGFYDDNAIELRLGTRVRSINTSTHAVHAEDGTCFAYDKLLIATGSRPRRLRVPGSELGGIFYLRDLGDAVAIRDAVGVGSRVAVVGAGWIGSEVAASLRHRGADVTLIDPGQAPLHATLGGEIGTMFSSLHARNGVRLRFGTSVERFNGIGQVESVTTTGGEVISVEVVVVGVGATPRLELAQGAGLNVAEGVVVDEQLRTSSAGVWAAGDVAAAWHPSLGRRIRVEHWANAKHQGSTAAKNMLGAGLAYDRLPYFFSDQYDVGFEFCGFVTDDARIVFRGDPESRVFTAFWMSGTAVRAVLAVNVWDFMDTAKALISGGRPLTGEMISDLAFDLDEFLAKGDPGR